MEKDNMGLHLELITWDLPGKGPQGRMENYLGWEAVKGGILVYEINNKDNKFRVSAIVDGEVVHDLSGDFRNRYNDVELMTHSMACQYAKAFS